MTMGDNKKFNKQIQKKEVSYKKYDNYNAIEVPLVTAIPSDHKGAMGVPISFFDKYSPDQFEIVGRADANIANENNKYHISGFADKGGAPLVDGSFVYKRILIKHKK